MKVKRSTFLAIFCQCLKGLWGYVIKIGKRWPRQSNSPHSSIKSKNITVTRWGETRAILPHCWCEHHHLSLANGTVGVNLAVTRAQCAEWRVMTSALTLVAKSDQRHPVSSRSQTLSDRAVYTRLHRTRGVYYNKLWWGLSQVKACLWLTPDTQDAASNA